MVDELDLKEIYDRYSILPQTDRIEDELMGEDKSIYEVTNETHTTFGHKGEWECHPEFISGSIMGAETSLS